MANYIGAVGVGFQPPQQLFPLSVSVTTNPSVVGSNGLSLPPGGTVVLPPGLQMVTPGQYSKVQIKDPVTGVWTPYCTVDNNAPKFINSDGTNYRVANRTGCIIGVLVNNGGTGFTSAPAVAATGDGAATFTAIVGGAVSALIPAAGGSGAGYTYPPIVNISVPPAPGVPATAVCAVSGGVITGFTIVNPGAGYTIAPTVTIVPNPTDPTIGTVTNASVTAQLSYVGVVTAILIGNHGLPQTAVPALSVTGGGGSGALATAVMDFVVTGYSVNPAGSGYIAPVNIMTSGGLITSSAAASNSPIVSSALLIPRNANINAVVNGPALSGGGSTAIIDGGEFQAPPLAFAIGAQNSAASVASAVITLTVGGVNDTVYIQNL